MRKTIPPLPTESYQACQSALWADWERIKCLFLLALTQIQHWNSEHMQEEPWLRVWMVSHRCGQPRGQSHLQVPFESEQSWNQDENLCDVPECTPVLLVTWRSSIRRRLWIRSRCCGYQRGKWCPASTVLEFPAPVGSTGPDQMCLAHLLLFLRKNSGFWHGAQVFSSEFICFIFYLSVHIHISRISSLKH